MDAKERLMQKLADKKSFSTIFSVMEYNEPSKPQRTLLKILLDDETQFTAELPELYQKTLPVDGEVKLLYHDLFTKDMVKGDISIRDIMHDAYTNDKRLEYYFDRQPGSAYKTIPPRGLDGGEVTVSKHGDRVTLYVASLLGIDGINGGYVLEFADLTETDKKGRPAYVLLMKRQQ